MFITWHTWTCLWQPLTWMMPSGLSWLKLWTESLVTNKGCGVWQTWDQTSQSGSHEQCCRGAFVWASLRTKREDVPELAALILTTLFLKSVSCQSFMEVKYRFTEVQQWGGFHCKAGRGNSINSSPRLRPTAIVEYKWINTTLMLAEQF